MFRGKRMGIWLLTAVFFTVLGSGCQTYFWRTGQTLPSGYYLQHPPQFIPESPAFPLQNELRSQQKAYDPLSIPNQPGSPGIPPL